MTYKLFYQFLEQIHKIVEVWISIISCFNSWNKTTENSINLLWLTYVTSPAHGKQCICSVISLHLLFLSSDFKGCQGSVDYLQHPFLTLLSEPRGFSFLSYQLLILLTRDPLYSLALPSTLGFWELLFQILEHISFPQMLSLASIQQIKSFHCTKNEVFC